jgi:hypothetical protein
MSRTDESLYILILKKLSFLRRGEIIDLERRFQSDKLSSYDLKSIEIRDDLGNTSW